MGLQICFPLWLFFVIFARGNVPMAIQRLFLPVLIFNIVSIVLNLNLHSFPVVCAGVGVPMGTPGPDSWWGGIV